MLFQKRSTRTRVSAESGFTQLGGHAIFLGESCLPSIVARPRCSVAPPLTLPPTPPTGSDDIQLGKNETLRDTAVVLSRYSDVVLARVFGHADIVALCRHSTSPVINALSDTYHPLQLLADVQTLEERFGSVEGLTLAWVGDGNNILNTFLSAAGHLGFHVQYATPKGFEPSAELVTRARAFAASSGVRIEGYNDPLAAVRGADVIVTDTWVSMGQEGEAAARKAAFAGYQVTEELATRGGARPGWALLHCLPRKPEEVDDAVFYGPRSLVWDEAENRKWTFQAVVLAQILGGCDV